MSDMSAARPARARAPRPAAGDVAPAQAVPAPSAAWADSARMLHLANAQRMADEHTARDPRFGHGPAAPVQRLMDKLKVDKAAFKKLTWSTVYLYAEYNGKPLGMFNSDAGGHAEENLIKKIKEDKLEKGSLTIYLSTTPCSSTFCTRDDGERGCQERLEALKAKGFEIDVKADHLYQPSKVTEGKEATGFPKGFSSYSAAATSGVPMSVSKLPKSFADDSAMLDTGMDGPVAQLKPNPVPASSPALAPPDAPASTS